MQQQQQQPDEDEEPPPLQHQQSSSSSSSDASCSSPSSTASSSSSSSPPGGVKDDVTAAAAAGKVMLPPPTRNYSTTTTTSQQQQPPPSSSSPPHSTSTTSTTNPTPITSCTCPSSLHSLNECSRVYSQCPVCLIKFDAEKPPIALSCSHTICLQCATLLVGIETEQRQQQKHQQQNNQVVVVGRNNVMVVMQQQQQPDGDQYHQYQQRGIVNEALLTFLDGKHTPMPTTTTTDPFMMRSCNSSSNTSSSSTTTTVTPPVVASLCRIARLIRSHTVSRSIHRKTILLINSLTPADLDPNATNSKLLKPLKSLGERCLVELTSSCAHVSHYHAQQQLWAAIRARACQFMGPAMQDEALRLVLLALEDGSALSRKVLVMFVVQRLAPQFPQASKTSVGHIVQLLYRASAFDVLKRPGNSSLMTLRAEFRNYEALRREHDTQIMKIGLEAGIRFTPEQYSSLLYGDTSQKPLMQSIIDKLQSPQTFQELLKEYLVSVQRLSNPDQLLVNLHPHFKVLSLIDVGCGGGSSQGSGNNTDLPLTCSTAPPAAADAASSAVLPPSHSLPELLDSLHAVLLGLITFTANRKHQRNNGGGNGNGNGTGSAVLGNGLHQQQPHHHGGPTLTRTASSGGVLQQVHATASTNSSAASAGLHFSSSISSSGSNKHHANHHHHLQHHGSVGYSTGVYPGQQQQQLLSRTVSGAPSLTSSANNNHLHHHQSSQLMTNNNNNNDNNSSTNNNNNNNVVITTTMMANLCV